MIFVFSLWGLTFCCSAWLTWFLASPRGQRISTLDKPLPHSLHSVPTPRSGGVAIFTALILGVVIAATLAGLGLGGRAFGLASWQFASGTGATMVLPAVALGAMSYLDDRVGLSPALRLAFQTLAASAVMLAGLSLDHISVPVAGNVELGWAGVPVSLLFILWMTNLYNFMDGLDGLAGGMAVSGFGFLSLLAYSAGRLDLALGGSLVVAASAGFLVHNYPPARIFMGDVGSIPLGFLVAAFTIKTSHDRVFEAWVPILLFSPFVVDATVTLLWRVAAGRRYWEPHREHFYQRLVLAGWSRKKTLWLEYMLMLASGLVACAYAGNTPGAKLLILVLVSAFYVVAGLAVLRVERRSKEALRSVVPPS